MIVSFDWNRQLWGTFGDLAHQEHHLPLTQRGHIIRALLDGQLILRVPKMFLNRLDHGSLVIRWMRVGRDARVGGRGKQLRESELLRHLSWL
jgi:hypothetical protein